jgi:hypothetical protein
MSGVKRTRTDEISSSQSQTTAAIIEPKIEPSSAIISNLEEDYNW